MFSSCDAKARSPAVNTLLTSICNVYVGYKQSKVTSIYSEGIWVWYNMSRGESRIFEDATSL